MLIYPSKSSFGADEVATVGRELPLRDEPAPPLLRDDDRSLSRSDDRLLEPPERDDDEPLLLLLPLLLLPDDGALLAGADPFNALANAVADPL